MHNLLIVFCILMLLIPKGGFAGTNSLCDVLKKHPSWYEDAKTVEKKWGVPVSVQLAIIEEESHFKGDAKNRYSSAFGFAQAENTIWDIYKRKTGNYKQTRNSFADATNFIGWYAKQTQEQVHVSPKDAYNLYLVYHDGAGGYLADKHWRNDPTKRLAEHVQRIADQYKKNLLECKDLR